MKRFLTSIARGDIETVSGLLEHLNFINKKGQTALHLAISEDESKMVQYLIDQGADIRIQEKKNGFTPLMVCLVEQPVNFMGMIEMILRAPFVDESLSLQDKTGMLAIHHAARKDNLSALSL